MSALAPGTLLTGKVSWFGGPNDPSSGPTTASGAPVTRGGIAVYNRSTLGGYWRLTFPNGRTVVEKQTDIGPAPWTGRTFDVLYSSLAGAGYSEGNFPTDQTVKGVYLGKSPSAAELVGPSDPTTPHASGAAGAAGVTGSVSAPGEAPSGSISSAPGGVVGFFAKALLYLALIAGAMVLVWYGTKTTIEPLRSAT